MRLEPELKEWLEEEAKRSDRSAGYVAVQAIAAQKARSDARRQMIKAAVGEADNGAFVSAEAMNRWFVALGTDHELPAPEPDTFIKRG